MMENVIEKHYVPTSGSGLDANLVAALMNNNNKSLDPATVALLRDNDKSSSRLSKSEEMDYNFHLAKVCCILCDYFKTEGLNPESYLNEVTRYKREER